MIFQKIMLSNFLNNTLNLRFWSPIIFFSRTPRRATIEYNSSHRGVSLPLVNVIFAFVVKVSDCVGGMSHDMVNKVSNHNFTTTENSPNKLVQNNDIVGGMLNAMNMVVLPALPMLSTRMDPRRGWVQLLYSGLSILSQRVMHSGYKLGGIFIVALCCVVY